MRLTLRLTLFLVLVSLGSLGIIGGLLVQAERADLLEAAQAETLLLGRALQVAMENALRDRQLEDVQESIDKLAGIEPGVLVALLSPEGIVLAPADARLGAVHALTQHARPQAVEFEPPGYEGHLVLVQRLLADDDQPLGFLLLARPLERLETDLSTTRRNVALGVVLVALTIGLLAALSGTLFIGRPLSQLMHWMRRIQVSGSLQEPPPARPPLMVPRDEILTLEQDFGAMVASLREAHRRQEELERGLVRIDKLAAVGQLAAGLAHEIGSPLQILCGRAQALVDQHPQSPEVQRQAAILVSQGERISRIVQRLLSFARVREPLKEPNDVVPLVRSVVDLLEYQARRSSISVTLDAPASLLAVCDRDLIQQLVLNLLTNAMRATRSGGQVRVELRRDGAFAQLAIADSGRGVDLAVKERLFEAFFTTSPEGEGTGLGLAIVRSIVAEHGGTIDVANRAEGGACFTVRWPHGQEATA